MQNLIVALIVLVALVYTVWRFLPARWRRRAVARLGLKPGVASAGSCHACDDCGACGSGSKQPGPR